MKSFASAILLFELIALAACGGNVEHLASPTDRINHEPSTSGTKVQPDEKYYIFVVNGTGENVTKYNRDGSGPIGSFPTGTSDPQAIALGASGQIYVANAGSNSVTTYQSGKPSSPTIKSGINDPQGVTVDASGKIYVTNYGSNTVTTYLSNGTPTTPTITSGLNGPQGIFVDSKGKIYVTNSLGNNLTTYLSNGTQTTPTITGLSNPDGVAVVAQHTNHGNIFVANKNNNTVTEYSSTGALLQTETGFDAPEGMALTNEGNINVTNYGDNSVTCGGFCRDFTQGLNGPTGIALHQK